MPFSTRAGGTTISTLGDLPDISQARLLGRASGAGTGDITELTAAQALAILGVSDYKVFAYRVTADTEDVVVNTDPATTPKFRVFMPSGPFSTWSVYEIFGSVSEAPTGSAIQFLVRDDGSSMFSGGTTVQIDATEEVSTTASSGYTLGPSPYIIGNGSEIAIDVSAVGSSTAGKGLIVYFAYKET